MVRPPAQRRCLSDGPNRPASRPASIGALTIHPAAPSQGRRLPASGAREVALRGVILIGGLATALALIVIYGGKAHLHWPDFSLLASQPLVLKLHIAGAVTALAIGTGLMFGPKGTTLHRTFGWTWVSAMMTTAISSFFLHFINPGGFSRSTRSAPTSPSACRWAWPSPGGTISRRIGG